MYVTPAIIETAAAQNDFWQVFYNTFMKQLSHPLALLLIPYFQLTHHYLITQLSHIKPNCFLV